MIRVLLADGHAMIRAGLRLLVETQSDMQVIADASTGDEALDGIRAEQPDVAVADLTMRGMGALDPWPIVRRCCEQHTADTFTSRAATCQHRRGDVRRRYSSIEVTYPPHTAAGAT